MRYLIELSGESENLAKAEATACALNHHGIMSDGRALILESDFSSSELLSRLALAWSVSDFMFSCKIAELDGHLEKLDLPGKSFRVRTSRLDPIHNPGDGTKLSRHVGEILGRRYKVDLVNPDVELRILMSSDIHAGILRGEVDRSAFEARKPENRPYKHPISLHPKLARALVNLTQVEKNQILLDPFCGTGGILMEAGLIGCHVLGGDIDQRMVDGTLQNLSHFGITNPDIRNLDISEWPKVHEKVHAIATDPPYGRSASTAKEQIGSLYSRTFSTCHAMLKKKGRLAIALPDEKHITLATGFTLEGMYPVRVHRSLTRHFCVFKKV
ncbi:MAG: RsmD family RNA methyltransferase [Thermoplasmata archaeon]|nr:RsmD family RNA methyltransferase [Thermoplasmata archaeon]